MKDEENQKVLEEILREDGGKSLRPSCDSSSLLQTGPTR